MVSQAWRNPHPAKQLFAATSMEEPWYGIFCFCLCQIRKGQLQKHACPGFSVKMGKECGASEDKEAAGVSMEGKTRGLSGGDCCREARGARAADQWTESAGTLQGTWMGKQRSEIASPAECEACQERLSNAVVFAIGGAFD